MSDSDVRIIPGWLWDLVVDFADGAPIVDVCTEPDNPLGATRFFALPERNGLEEKWLPGMLHWCNPPFSSGSVIQWAEKAVCEARRAGGAESVLLTKDDSRTRWNAYLRYNADVRVRVQRGIGFSKPDGNGGYVRMVAPAWGHAVHYFGRRRRRFARVFGTIGEVTPLWGPQEVGCDE